MEQGRYPPAKQGFSIWASCGGADCAQARAALRSASKGPPGNRLCSHQWGRYDPPRLPSASCLHCLSPTERPPDTAHPGPCSFPGLPSTSGGPGGSVNTHVCILRCVLCSCCEAQRLRCGRGQKQGKPLFLTLLRVRPQSPAPGVRLHPLPTSKHSAFASRSLSANFFFPDASCSWNICVINYFSLDT